MNWSLFAAALVLQPSPPPAQRDASPMIRDIIAGYKAWDLQCTPAQPGVPPASCSTQSSDQITTIALVRTAAGLNLTLESRRCPEGTPAQTAFIPRDRIKPVHKPLPYVGKRVGRVYAGFTALEDAVLKSCNLSFDADGPRVYDLLLIDHFLRQSDVVAAADR